MKRVRTRDRDRDEDLGYPQLRGSIYSSDGLTFEIFRELFKDTWRNILYKSELWHQETRRKCWQIFSPCEGSFSCFECGSLRACVRYPNTSLRECVQYPSTSLRAWGWHEWSLRPHQGLLLGRFSGSLTVTSGKLKLRQCSSLGNHSESELEEDPKSRSTNWIGWREDRRILSTARQFFREVVLLLMRWWHAAWTKGERGRGGMWGQRQFRWDLHLSLPMWTLPSSKKVGTSWTRSIEKKS